jgi:hypothetical protein
MNDTLAQSLYHYGLSVERLASADLEQLAEVPGFSAEKAAEIKTNAAAMIASGKLAEMKKQLLEAEKAAVLASKTNSDAVFERLKAEVKAHAEKERTSEGEAVAAVAKADSSEESGS